MPTPTLIQTLGHQLHLWHVPLLIIIAIAGILLGRGRLLNLLLQGYLLRVPLLTVIAVVGFYAAAFSWSGTSALLGNVFYITSYRGLFYVSSAAFLLAWVVVATWRLVRYYGRERFVDVDFWPTSSDLGQWGSLFYVLLFLPIVLPVVGGTLQKSTELDSFWGKGMFISLGFVAALVFVVIVTIVQLLVTRSDVAATSPDLFLPTRSPLIPDRLKNSLNRVRNWDGVRRLAELIAWPFRHFPRDVFRGYFRYSPRCSQNGMAPTVDWILPGHVAAGILLILTLVAYLRIGAVEHGRLSTGESLLPTLAYLLLLAMLLCWVFSGLAFFLDRYRIPVFIPLVMLLYATSHLPYTKADYFYTTVEPVKVSENEEFSENYFVVVAANGGGIQSAAWTARVLTGLEEACGEGCGKKGFAESIRLVSAASGGSVGTMYFVNEYTEERELPENELDGIVRRAERSSLDQIAWGLLYPDLLRTIIPVYKPIWDRGRALEEAWLRRGMKWDREGADWNREGIERKLSEWQKDAQAGDRPAVIFNTTIAETGEPLPLATTDLPDKMLTHAQLFEEGENQTDVRVVTAARLSAAYPYVSPAARADVQEGEKAASHIVDGGYYDNYGISSLAAWLDWTLEKEAKKIDKVLIVEIHGAPSGPRSTKDEEWNCPAQDRVDQARRSKQGWFYQGLAPVETVLSVRGAGQRAHNEVELDLLKDRWNEKDGAEKVRITRALFEFDGTEPPLSWHLTEKQKREIETVWQDELTNPSDKCAGWNVVENFFAKQAEGSG